FRTGMNNLSTTGIVDGVWATHKPIAEPLIRNVGPHAVVRGRGNHPIESGLRCFWLESLDYSAVCQSHNSHDIGRHSVVTFCSPFDHGQDINGLRHESPPPPKAGRIGRLRCVGTRALVGEVTWESLLLRTMQCTQDNATECDAGICCAILKK